jgi:hypothetical protein
MSSDWIRIAASFWCAVSEDSVPDSVYIYPFPSFVPLSAAVHIRRIDNKEQLSMMQAWRLGALHAKQWLGRPWEEQMMRLCEFPIYCVFFKDVTIVHPREQSGVAAATQPQCIWCVVHPDERERMERYLSGTHNPLHDLVHELRYNPRVGVAPEKEDAKERFYSKENE